MRVYNEKQHQEKKEEFMKKCFECYAEHDSGNVGIESLGKACGVASGNLYTYFDDSDVLIVESTEYCMAKVEKDFLQRAPRNVDELKLLSTKFPIGRQVRTENSID